MRVDCQNHANERRDAIDQNWYSFLNACGYQPFLIPNKKEFDVSQIAQQLAGVILTGGNDLSILGGDPPERDELEFSLLKYCFDNSIPVLGICRGMQIGGVFFGAKLVKVKNHVLKPHQINWESGRRTVNSYHNYGFLELPDCFEILAQADDGVIEAFQHKTFPFIGLMSHPEREQQIDLLDVKLLKKHFRSIQ